MAVNTETAKWDVEGGPQYNNGLVISDAATNGNEWVWIPVEDPSSLYETASSPIAITGGIGKTYVTGVSTSKYSTSGIISGSYGTRVLPNDTTSYREPDVVVGSNGTAYDAVEANRTTAGFTKNVNGTVTTMTLSEMAQTMVDEYSEMIASIEKYGGFYIGRYELSSVGVKKDHRH